MLVALLALFVALSGTAVAAGVPALAKRALIADNAKKLNGQTSAQLLAAANTSAKQAADAAASAVAQQPGPASTAASLVSTKAAPFGVAPGGEQIITATCDAGSKATGGGFTNPTSALVLSAGSQPSADGSGWTEDLVNVSSSTTGAGTVVAVCVK
jgi:hypothetical protein